VLGVEIITALHPQRQQLMRMPTRLGRFAVYFWLAANRSFEIMRHKSRPQHSGFLCLLSKRHSASARPAIAIPRCPSEIRSLARRW